MEEQKTKEQWAIENAALIKERDQLSNACTYLMSELHLSQQEAGQKAAQVILLKTQKAQSARETADALNALEADLRQRETIIVDLANKLEHQISQVMGLKDDCIGILTKRCQTYHEALVQMMNALRG